MTRWLKTLLTSAAIALFAACTNADAVGTCRSGSLYCTDSEGFVHAQGLVVSPGPTTLAGTTTLSGDVAINSTRACVNPVFTRTSSGFCAYGGTQPALTSPVGVCTNVFAGMNLIPSGSTGVFKMTWVAKAGNGVAFRSNAHQFYQAAGCGSVLMEIAYGAYEFAATAAGTIIGRGEITFIAPALVNGGNNVLYYTSTNAGGNGNAESELLWLIGYFD